MDGGPPRKLTSFFEIRPSHSGFPWLLGAGARTREGHVLYMWKPGRTGCDAVPSGSGICKNQWGKNSPQEAVPRLISFFFKKQKSKFPQKAYFIYTNINVCWFFEHLSNWLTELLVWLSRVIFWIFMMPSLATKFEVSDV